MGLDPPIELTIHFVDKTLYICNVDSTMKGVSVRFLLSLLDLYHTAFPQSIEFVNSALRRQHQPGITDLLSMASLYKESAPIISIGREAGETNDNLHLESKP